MICFDNGIIAPRMSSREIEALNNTLLNSKNIIEFGSGGTTFQIMLNSESNLISYDTDNDFINYLENHEFLQKYIASGRLKLFHIDIGPTGSWGAPLDSKNLALLKPIFDEIWRHPNSNIDSIIIDGRFRLFIALRALYAFPDATFLFHDFPLRRQYHDLIKFIDIIDIVDSLLIYKRANEVDIENYIMSLIEGIYDPS